jgi:YHS domain-containing protein
MKKLFVLGVFLLSITFIHAQKAEWKEMHDFHGIMSATFHPSEENNLKPLRDSATVLVNKARNWQKSTVPSGYNSAITKPILKRLVAECEAIKAAVLRDKPDTELKTMIAKAHDTFHEIMEKCRENTHEPKQSMQVTGNDVLKQDGIDPVCHMKVKKGSTITTVHNGKQYGFCNETCKMRFLKSPGEFLQ